MNPRNHAVDDEEIPPGPAPTFLQNWRASPVVAREELGIDGDALGQLLRVEEHFPGLLIPSNAVEGNDKNHHGLEDEAITPFQGDALEAMHGFLEEAISSCRDIDVERSHPAHGRHERLDAFFM